MANITTKQIILGLPAFSFSRQRGLLIAFAVFFTLFLIVNFLSASPLAYFDYQYISSGGMTLAIAAVGATIVILTGGFDLSVGAVVTLVNVLVATSLTDDVSNQFVVGILGVCIGAAVGAINGYFVAFQRLQSIVVTLSTMFILNGIALLWLHDPGGYIPASFSNFFVGSAIENWLPAPILILVAVIAAWLLIKNSRFGTAIYAIGSDEEAAEYSGIDVRRTKFFAYVCAGAFYGLAGVVVTAQTTTGDPLLGQSMLLEVFTAVVLGGTLLGGGRGGCVGTIFGAYSLMLIVNILLVLNVPAFYSSIVQGGILLLAAIGLSLSSMKDSVRWLQATLRGKRGTKFSVANDQSLSQTYKIPEMSWYVRNKETLAYVLPSYILFFVVVIAMVLLNGSIDATYLNSLLLLSSFLIILALGQGSVILIGGLDLSVAWMITFGGVLVGELTKGNGDILYWVIPLVLCVGILVGLINGFLIVFFRLPAIVVTLAMNGMLQGVTLLTTGGTPTGFAPERLKLFMAVDSLGIAPVVFFVVAFAVGGLFLLGKTNFGRRVYAVGNNPRVAHLSGVNVGSTVLAVYALSGFCSALVGILLAGFSGRAILGMGDQYLLPSIAVVVVGGTLITGGRGKYIGMLGGVFLLVALQILLAGTTLPPAVRIIIFGLVVLLAISTLRDKSHAR